MAQVGMSNSDLAAICEVHANTVSRWKTGRARVPGIVLAYLEMRRQLLALTSKEIKRDIERQLFLNSISRRA